MTERNSAVASMEVGDYISGETAVWRIAGIDADAVTVEAAAPFASTSEEYVQRNAGEVAAEAIGSYGSHVPAGDVESVDVSDGMELVWTPGTISGEPADATIALSDDDSVTVESDGRLVPEAFNDVLQLKVNIALGNATVNDGAAD